MPWKLNLFNLNQNAIKYKQLKGMLPLAHALLAVSFMAYPFHSQ
jgi:hypothetical protein